MNDFYLTMIKKQNKKTNKINKMTLGRHEKFYSIVFLLLSLFHIIENVIEKYVSSKVTRVYVFFFLEKLDLQFDLSISVKLFKQLSL